MSTFGCVKAVCLLFSLIIFGLLCAGGLTYWRDIHNIPDQNLSPYQKWMFENINFGTTNQYAVYKNDEIIAHVGIMDNCESKIESAQDDCKYFNDHHFIGNTAINILMMVAASIYLVSFNVLICCSKKTCILPFLCFGSTLCIIAGISIFWINYKKVYINLNDTVSESERIEMKKSGFNVHDDYVTILLPWKITFGIGFYLVLGAAALSIFTMLLSINLALINPEKKKPAETPDQEQQQPPATRLPSQQQRPPRQCPQQESHHQFQSYPPQSSAPALNCPYQQGFSAQHYPTQTTPIYQPPPLSQLQPAPICPLTPQHQQQRHIGFAPSYTPSQASHQQIYMASCTLRPPPPAAAASASSSIPSTSV